MKNIKYTCEIKIGNTYLCLVLNDHSVTFKKNVNRRCEGLKNVGTDSKSNYVKYESYVCYCRIAMTKVSIGWLWFNAMFSNTSAIK